MNKVKEKSKKELYIDAFKASINAAGIKFISDKDIESMFKGVDFNKYDKDFLIDLKSKYENLNYKKCKLTRPRS